MNDTSKVLIATVSGVALGIAAGLLVAPQSGKDTRDQLNDRVRKARTDLDDLIARTRSTSKDVKKEAKTTANNIKDATAKA